MADSVVINVDGLTKRFNNFTAVDNVSFAITAGQIVGLLGGNGAGKTTTLSMLIGILLPTSGQISILGHNMLKDRHAALKQMNLSSPYVDLPLRLLVRDTLKVFCHLYNIPNAKERMASLAMDLQVSHLMDRPYGSLSAGQKTRISLFKSLLNEPKVLLLDEPTASLDPDTADWVRSYLVNYQRKTGATLLLASHNMLEVERICSDVIMMKDGRIADRGAPSALLAKYGRETMEDVFLHIARTKQDVA